MQYAISLVAHSRSAFLYAESQHFQTRAGNSRFESIQQSESNQIPMEFDLFGRLQSQIKSYLLVYGSLKTGLHNHTK